ncbi:MAG: phosphosulfolactate synthase [Acidimicrobiales bacterium]
MNQTALTLPRRSTKPRRTGLTMVVDGGLPLGALRDLVASAGEYLDLVKFGWGTAVVSGELEDKLVLLQAHGIEYYVGGTLFEKHVLQDRFDAFRALCHRLSCRYVEVSNGTIDLSNTEKAGYVRKLADEFTVISEVGFKDADRSERLSPRRWIEYVEEDLEAGAELVTLEARESGSSGICRPDGRLRFGLVEDLVAALPLDRLLFEAPGTTLQAYFVERLGPDVNLGNVAATGVLGLETLRLGLRADTLLALDPGRNGHPPGRRLDSPGRRAGEPRGGDLDAVGGAHGEAGAHGEEVGW